MRKLKELNLGNKGIVTYYSANFYSHLVTSSLFVPSCPKSTFGSPHWRNKHLRSEYCIYHKSEQLCNVSTTNNAL